MNEKYLELFRGVCQATEILAERVLDYSKTKNDEKTVETSEVMRQDYSSLHDRLRAEDFNPETLTKSDFIKFYVGVLIVINNMQDQIDTLNKSINGYKIDVMPKLQQIVNGTENDEEARKLANELFQVND